MGVGGGGSAATVRNVNSPLPPTPGPRSRDTLRKGLRLRRALAAVAVFCLSATTSVSVLAQEVNPLGMGFGLDGSMPLGFMSPTDAWMFDVTPLNLGDIDPLSGGMITHDVEIDNGLDRAATHALMDTQQMAIDTQQLAEVAKRRAEAKRLAALKKGIAVSQIRGMGYPEEWELDNFSTCGQASNARYQARIEVVAAWEVMCRDAEADGVKLGIVSAYRSIEHQTRLWNQKLKETGGDEKAAAKWVARPGRSQHNRGLAIDTNVMTGAPNVKAWMHARVGCYRPPDNLRMGMDISCTSNERVVKRVQLYGFIFPMDHEPWHIELGIQVNATASGGITSCNPSPGISVPEMIGAIWRCRLGDAGITGGEQARVVAEAVMVAQCESGWKPTAFIHGGKYANTPNPVDGLYYTARGVFQFIRVSGDNWIEGGWANADDPVANIDAAARYYLYERGQGREGWGPWSCRRVLPQYGGKALPEWAYQY